MNKKWPKTDEDGFSLLELLIAIVIFTVITGVTFSLLNEALKASTFSTQQTEAQQNLRTGQEYVTRDLYNAADGLRGLNPIIRQEFVATYLSQDVVKFPNLSGGGPDPLTTAGFVPAGMIMTDNEVPQSTMVRGADAGTMVLQGTDRLTLFVTPDIGSGLEIQSSPITVGGQLTHRTAGASEMFVSSSDAAQVKAGQIYLLFDTNASSLGSGFVTVTSVANLPNNKAAIKFDTTGGYLLNDGTVNQITDSNTDPLTLKRVWMIHYFVDDQKRLIRRVFGQQNPANLLPFSDNIITEHVTQLEFRHILREVPANGTVLTPQIIEQFTNKSQQDAVRQVEVAIGIETVQQVVQNPKEVDGRRVDASTVTITSPRNLQFFNSLQPTRLPVP